MKKCEKQTERQVVFQKMAYETATKVFKKYGLSGVVIEEYLEEDDLYYYEMTRIEKSVPSATLIVGKDNTFLYINNNIINKSKQVEAYKNGIKSLAL